APHRKATTSQAYIPPRRYLAGPSAAADHVDPDHSPGQGQLAPVREPEYERAGAIRRRPGPAVTEPAVPELSGPAGIEVEVPAVGAAATLDVAHQELP